MYDDTGSPISLIKPDYAPINCRTSIAKGDYRFNGLNDSRLEIMGIFESNVKVNDINIKIRCFIIPDNTMSGTMLLGRDFISNPAVKVVIDQTLKILQTETDLPVDTDDCVDQILHIDCIDQSSPCELDLKVNENAPYDVTRKLKNLYRDVYLSDTKLVLPESAGNGNMPEA